MSFGIFVINNFRLGILPDIETLILKNRRHYTYIIRMHPDSCALFSQLIFPADLIPLLYALFIMHSYCGWESGRQNLFSVGWIRVRICFCCRIPSVKVHKGWRTRVSTLLAHKSCFANHKSSSLFASGFQFPSDSSLLLDLFFKLSIPLYFYPGAVREIRLCISLYFWKESFWKRSGA